MEQKIDELLKQLHKFLFADSEQVVNELRIYLLDDSLKEADLAFISSKIFNSKLSLLEFLRQNALQQDKLLSSVKKKVNELMIDYLKNRSQEMSPYLSQIKDTCLLSFRSDSNSLVKESSLQLVVKIIETFNSREIEPLIKPKDMMIMLLDEIKLRRPSASVKGTIFNLVGLLHDKYGLEDFRVESQDQMFIQLQEQMKSDKPEIKAIIGIMKGLTYSLTNECTLDDDQIEALYRSLKIAIQPIADMQHKGVMKAAMKLLGTHIRLFKKQITAHSIELVTITLKLCVNENMETRDAANEMLGNLIQQISDGLTRDQSIHRDIFRNIMIKIQGILDDPSHTNILLISTIKAVGIFSKAIQTFMGDDQLYKYLEQLIQVSENKIIKEFEQQEDPKNDYKNFKQILKKQKQLISFIESYSYILQNLNQDPSEAFLLHFHKVCEIGVRHHRKLYQKYRSRFYDALASFTKALSNYKAPFSLWIKKFVRQSLIDTLKIPDAVLFGGESPFESLQDAVQFWRDWLNKDEIWSDFTCRIVYDELIQTIIERIDELNLTYKVEKGRQTLKAYENQEENNHNHNQAQVINEEFQGLQQDYVVSYIANNNTDQQFLVRLSNFAEMFLLQCKDGWFLRWIPTFCGVLIKKAQQTSRISKLYSLMKVSMQICSNHKYFEEDGERLEEDSTKGEKLNTYNMLLTFFKELIGKQEEYQDQLLTSCLDLLLHVPVQILYRKDKRTDNVYLWKGIMFKALDIGRTNNSLAMNSITMLEQWFNLLPMNVTIELYDDILPKLSDFLQVEDSSKSQKKNKQSEVETYQYLEMLKTGNEVNIERKDIALKVLDLLGKIGGHAHSIINNDQNKIIEKENFIKWDPEKRLKFTIPLYTKKIDIYFDAVLPKLVDLAQNSNDRETRVAACEFLHALVIFMIGKNATLPKGRHKQDQEIAPFAKIYQKLFPVIIKLATDVENISRQLFEPLIFQIVRWFSSSRVYEHPEVESLLDALIDGASSRNNSALREMCSNAVAEFAKWSLKQMTDKDIKENPNNVKSLIRRIESNSNHPDPFKRLSSVLCFSKIFSIIRDFDPLVDRFCLEIAHNVLASLKMCHNSLEFSQEVIDNCSQMLTKISKVCSKKAHLLMIPNPKRSIHPSIYTFVLYLFEKFVAIETVCRKECMKLWEVIVKSLPPKNSEGMPDDPERWVFDYYIQKRGEKAIFKRLMKIRFEEQKNDDINNNNNQQRADARKTQLSERQKTLDQLSAQLECFTFLMNKKIITFNDMNTKLIDVKLWISNLQSFIQDDIIKKFKKNQQKSLDKLIICKEDKEAVTKTRIYLITQFFKYLLALDNKALLWHLDQFEEGTDFQLPQFCIQIILIPSIHQLQVLVEDQELERQLRNQCELVLKRLLEITNLDLFKVLNDFVLKQNPIISLDRIKPTNVEEYHPKLLTSLCLGYLKLSVLDENIKQNLLKKKHLLAVVEEWLQKESPIHNESSRILVKFLSKLEIPNEILSEWLTFKTEIYQKTGDILLTYIAENWNNERLYVGEYLISKAVDEIKLFGVFIPILERVNEKKVPNYHIPLLQYIPIKWGIKEGGKDFEDFEIASNKIKIYAFIVNNCKHLLIDKSNKLGLSFLSHLCDNIETFLKERYPVHIKKEVLNLVGLIYNMTILQSNGKYQNEKPVHERLEWSLRNLQQQFFPIKTKELQKNSNLWNNFHIIMDGFLNLLLLSKNLKVLRLLYRSIREHKTTYESNLKRTLNIIITQQINRQDLPTFKETLRQFFEEFLNRDLDRSIDDNLRWAIMKKIILKILETCSLNYLAEIMIDYTPQFEQILEQPFKDVKEQPLEFYLRVKEKTRIFLVFEVMFRRLKAETIRTYVHQKIYGEKSKGNEITRSLIQACSIAKKGHIDNFIPTTKEYIQTDFQQFNSPFQVQRQFICSAYSCLTAVIMNTQTKENLFSQFLFVINRDKGDESLWHLIVDTEKSYNFEVETNFNYVQLKNLEMKIEQSNQRDIGDIAEIRANNLINEYVTTSFMSANEKFNSAMVFETQPDKVNLKSEEEKLQKLISRKQEAMEYQRENGNSQDNSLLQNNIQKMDSDETLQMEMDNVNKHECMKNIKRCIDKMQELFGQQWQNDKNQEMPLFMQSLNAEIRRPETHLNVKIFILKILINHPQEFQPYASHWFEPIANYCCDKNNGGKGFHYFMRDLCTLLISWNYTPEDIPKNRTLCTTMMNTLIKYAADKTKMIFNTNIQIIAGLLHRWRRLIAVNKDMISMMIGMDDKKEGSNLWKMTGIQILALTVSFDIPIIENPNSINNLQPNQRHFQLEERPDSLDKLLNNLLKIQSSKKKQIIQAASETLGKILARQPTLLKHAITALMENEENERHDVLVNSIEKITREFPQLLDDRRIFMKLLSFVKVLTGSMRSAILKSFERYIELCRERKQIADINQITLSLQADSDDVLADISDENQQAFLLIITQIAKLNTEQGDVLLQKVLPRLKQLFVANKNDYSRGLFYDLMVYLYDQYEDMRPIVKSALIRGLSDKAKLVRDKLISFWSDPARLELDPTTRLQQLMEQLYTQEEEAIWLNNSVYLLMQITNKSSDFERKIFDQPLQNCKFHPLEINQFGHNLNRSQPLTPLFSQMDQVFQASQAHFREMQQQQQLAPIQEAENENQDDNGLIKQGSNDIEMIDTSTNPSSNKQKLPSQQSQQQSRVGKVGASGNFNASQQFSGSQIGDDITESQFYNQNVIRATQIPQFTQTQTELSSLIASSFMRNDGSSSPIQDSISASFYEINRINKRQSGKSLTQVLQIKTGSSGLSGSQDGNNEMDNQGFLAPKPMRKKKNDLRKFFAQNQYVYKPQESQGQRIRYVPQGSMPMHLQRQDEIRNMQREQYLNRQRDRMRKQVGLYRKYRVGELPDIQINFKDVLLPLSAMIKNDTTMATEIFVEVFSEIYKSQNDQQIREQLGNGVRSVLSQSITYDYGCINCMHRVAMELLKADGFSIQAEVIQRTGQHSMSYQTALALIEETIIHGKDIHDAKYNEVINRQGQKRRHQNDSNSQNSRKANKGFAFSQLSDANRKCWFNMIDLYEQIGNNDALQGIWSFLADEDGIIFKKKPDDNGDMKLSQDQEKTVNLIKEAHVLKSKGSISEGLHVLEQALNDPKLTECLEDHIKIELQNKRLDSKAELLKWDEIAGELATTYKDRKLQDIPFAHADKLIKAQIRTDDFWNNLNRQIEIWQHDSISKAYLDKNFNFELALNALTCKDYDRARFYLDKETNELLSQWRNLTKLSQVSQHILVQRIQKLYEMREFLSIVKSEGMISKDELIPQVVRSIQHWIQRVPSYAFDHISVWDDILTSRNLYLDLYKFRLKQGLEDQLRQKRDLCDISAILQVQCAKGSYKMGLYDSSDRFLKRALKMRSADDNTSSNMKIVGPIIKLKGEQFKSETMNLDYRQKSEKLHKILNVLEKKMKDSFDQENLHNKAEDINTEIKSLLLRQRLEKKMLNIILSGVQGQDQIQGLKEFDDNCTQYLSRSFGTLGQVIEKVKVAAQYDDQMKNTMAKTYFKFAQFSDKILRKMENENCNIVLRRSLQKIKKTEEEVARQSIRYGLQALNLEYQKASDIIPRLLDIVSKYKDSVEGEFIAHSKDTPAWFFLRWINQIVSIINRQESSVIEEKVVQIAKRYPQALFYPFKVIESNIQVNVLDSDIQKTPLFTKLSKFFEKSFRNLNSWIESLDCLVYPEHRFKYWQQILSDLLSEENSKLVPKNKLKEIIQYMMQDLVGTERKLVGDQIGSYNKKFAEKYGKPFIKVFGQDACNVDKMNHKQLSQLMQQLNQKISETMGTLGQGYEKVSTFSEWLDSLDINDFYNPYEYIEVPGQYENLRQEPLVEKNVKIASVRKSLLILGSIRRPKRLTVHGSNEKDYHLLVKGGEDLRLDQRVQQLFQIMNSIFKDDAQCQNRDLYIKTFKVVPITNRLGTLEWVDNTEPMKNIINREHIRVEGNGKDLNQSRALAERRKWLKASVPGNAKKDSIAEQHLQLLGCDEKIVIDGFNKHKDAMPWFLLRNGLENLCLTSSAFLAIKNQFTKSLATFSIASYLIGIGDRHLENFLIDTSDGEILGIDFGIAFGSGTQLGIPELMPFRLTQQIEGVIAPHPLEGVYKQTMVHALTALMKRKSLIMDTCEIFVKEPLLDWVKDAKQKQKTSNNDSNQGDNGGVVDSLISEYEEELQELAWYPRKKIEIVRDKLHGLNPVKILAKELKDSKHEKRSYIKTILRAIEGPEDAIRHQLLRQRKKYLDVDEYVDCLIEQARDPNILGRTWIGWSPYI